MQKLGLQCHMAKYGVPMAMRCDGEHGKACWLIFFLLFHDLRVSL